MGIVARFVVCVVVDSWLAELSAVKTFGGPWLLDRCCLLCRETQEEHWWDLDLRRSDVDDDRASRDATSARVVHSPSSSCCRIWTRRCSAGDQQSCHSSSSDGHSESH